MIIVDSANVRYQMKCLPNGYYWYYMITDIIIIIIIIIIIN